MANTTLKVTEQNVVSGLGTWTYNVLAAGLHQVRVQANELPTSGLIATINHNGSPVSPSPTPSPSTAQQIVDVQAAISCAINDVITVVLSSAQVSDSLPNAVKATISIYINPS